MLHSDFWETNDLFKDYFENLVEYTGERDYIEELANIEYQHEVDINLFYAQALILYKDSFRHWSNHEEIKNIDANNE